MSLLVLYNPVCGDRTAKQFVDEHVLPVLENHGRTPTKLVATEGESHAGRVVADFIEESGGGTVTVVLASGDGTVHEIINHLCSVGNSVHILFVLIPCGTANALYSSLFPPKIPPTDTNVHKLKSLQSFIDASPTKPLTLAKTSFSSSSVYSVVVTSTALHASILHDSEELRAEMPGIERFKVAARNNITRWYNASVNLLPLPSTGSVEIYDPALDKFLPSTSGPDGSITLQGPFAYFLSTVNVDRLEPLFRISPLASSSPASTPSVDVVILRPLRDPSITIDSPDSRLLFAQKSGQVLGEAYNDGNHIKLRYDGSPANLISHGEGQGVVEYFRCAGWEWLPNEADEPAHLLCADGTIFHIERRGRARCGVISDQDHIQFAVYV